MAKIYKKGIVKRRGHEEDFDEKKVYASAYASCLNVHLHHLEAEKIAEKVSKAVKTWAKKKDKITSDDIFKKVIDSLNNYSKDAAFMYETHRDIS